MRILVISRLPPFTLGGAERQASRLIVEWRRAGHEVMVFGADIGASRVDLAGFSIPARRIRIVQGWGRAMRALSYFVSLSLLLVRHRRWPDVIYCRFLGDAAVTVALLKALGLLRVPLVAVPANAGPDGDTAYLRKAPLAGLLPRLLERRCEAINLIAPRMESDLRDYGLSARQFHTIPNGISLAPVPARQWHGERRFVAVGRLAEQKGLDVLLKALATLQPQTSAARIRIVGEGPLRAQLAEQARVLGLSSCVEFMGEASEAEVRRHLAEAHVFLLPSRYEGFSNAALEAMESGLPVIVSRCGGIDTYLRPDMGWVVEPGDVASLAEALRAALAAPAEALADMGARCRAEVEASFDIRRVAARNVELFRSLARA